MPSKNQSILIGAAVSVIVGIVLAFITYNSASMVMLAVGGCTGCLLAFIGPIIAVWHYTSTHNLTIPAGEGAALGAITGVVASVASWAITFALRAADVFPTAAEWQQQTMDMVGAAGGEAPDMGTGGFMSTPVGELVIGLVMGAVIGAIGGAIGAAIFKKGGEMADEFDV